MATKTKTTRIKTKSPKTIALKQKNKFALFAFAAVFAVVGLLLLRASNANTGWTLAYADEFDGTSVNTSKWQPYNSTYGDGNFETHCLQPSNATVSGGTLKILTKKESVKCPTYSTSLGWKTPYREYTSAFLGSRESGTYYPKYARYEIRAKSPQRKGISPGIWLRHINGSSTMEIDIMESFQGSAPGTVTSTVHAQDSTGVMRYNAWKSSQTIGTTPGWHTWAVEIEPVNNDTEVEVRFYIDGVLLPKNGGGGPFRIGGTGKKNTFDNIGTNGFDIALNTAVNINHTGNAAPDSPDWYCPASSNWTKVSSPSQAQTGWKVAEMPMKNPDGTTFYRACTSPQPTKSGGITNNPAGEIFEIDYVRVYTRSTSTTPPPPPEDPVDPAPTQLATPTNLKATPGDKKLSLNWNAVSGADNYTVRWRVLNGTWQYSNASGISGNPKTNSYTINNLTNGVAYEISVAARDSTGKITGSAYSPSIQATPKAGTVTAPSDTQAPTAPTNLRKSTQANLARTRWNMKLEWDASTDNVGVVGYEIFRDGKLIGETTNTSFIDDNFNYRVEMTYQIKSVDAVGNRSQPLESKTRTGCFMFVCYVEY